MEQNTMHRRAFFLAGPLGALIAVLGFRSKPKLLLQQFVATSDWGSLKKGDIFTIDGVFVKNPLFTDAERAAAKLALVRK